MSDPQQELSTPGTTRSDVRAPVVVSFAAEDRDWADWVRVHLDALGQREREAFLAQLAEVDLPLMARLVAGGGDARTDLSTLAPAPYVALGSPVADARAHGEALLREGRVAAAARARASAGAGRRAPIPRPA